VTLLVGQRCWRRRTSVFLCTP